MKILIFFLFFTFLQAKKVERIIRTHYPMHLKYTKDELK